VKTGEKKTKTEDAVAERRTCFAEDEQSKCNQTGKKKEKKAGPKTLRKQRKRQARRRRYVFKAKTPIRSPEREQKIKEEKSVSAAENVATRSSSSSCCLTSEHCM
jgi:hypothetical protein